MGTEDKWCLCSRCIEAIKSRGEEVFVGKEVVDDDDDKLCEWCGEHDTLYECI